MPKYTKPTVAESVPVAEYFGYGLAGFAFSSAYPQADRIPGATLKKGATLNSAYTKDVYGRSTDDGTETANIVLTDASHTGTYKLSTHYTDYIPSSGYTKEDEGKGEKITASYACGTSHSSLAVVDASGAVIRAMRDAVKKAYGIEPFSTDKNNKYTPESLRAGDALELEKIRQNVCLTLKDMPMNGHFDPAQENTLVTYIKKETAKIKGPTKQ